MITVTYHSSDARLAGRLQADLRGRSGYSVGDGVPTGRDHVLIAVLSPEAIRDAGFMNGLYRAFDSGQRVVPVLAAPVDLPDSLAPLEPVDFSSGDAFDALRARVAAALSPDAGLPSRVRTPHVQASNRRWGYLLVGIILVIFAISTYLLATGIVAMPREEYDEINTQAGIARDLIIGPTMEYLSTVLPRGTDQAAAFPATLDAIPTLLRPFVAASATAIYDQLAEIYATEAPELTPPPAAGD